MRRNPVSLRYRDHPYLPLMWQAKYKGFSVVFGQSVEGYEIMDPEGEIHHFATNVAARSFIRLRTQGVP